MIANFDFSKKTFADIVIYNILEQLTIVLVLLALCLDYPEFIVNLSVMEIFIWSEI